MSIKARPIKANVKLNNKYENVIRFDTEQEKTNYFDSLESGFYNYLDLQPEINFNVGDTINTSVTLDITKFGASLNQALNYNYLVIKDTSFQKPYLYYFITGATIRNLNVVTYQLELDIFTTYNINSDFSVNDFVVDRCHIDRFNEGNSKDSYSFNLKKTSLIHHTEELESRYNSTYPDKKINLKFERTLYHQDAEELFNQINGWLVCYKSGSGTSIMKTDESSEIFNSTLYLPYDILIAPMKGIKVKNLNGTYYDWSARELYEKYKEGTSTEETYSFGVLQNCPIENWNSSNPNQYRNLFYKEGNNIVFDFENYVKVHGVYNQTTGDVIYTSNQQFIFMFNDTLSVECEFQQIQLDKQIKNCSYINDLKTIFEGATKNDLKSMDKEPKLLKKPFTTLSIKDEDSEGFEFNIFDLCDTFINVGDIKAIETPSPECTKSFISFDTVNDTFLNNLFKTGVGFIKNNVFNLPVVDDAYKSYIRQNKNSAITGLAIPIASAAASTALGLATGGVGAAVAGGQVINQSANAANYFANMDNLKNTPDGVKNSGNDFLHSFTKGSIKPYLEVKKLRYNDMVDVFSYFYKYGYCVQRRLSSSELFGRYIFNYIKSMDDVSDKITTNNGLVLSNSIKNTINNVLNKGVTFWESNSTHLFDYDYENYEKRIIEG